MRNAHSRSAFTLLEISIGLAVAALLVAGVFIGRGLIENAKLQSVAADFSVYKSAVLNYREKYKELPGDHSNATSLSSADGGCPDPVASNAITTATCNGNGDGFIGNNTGDPTGAMASYYESLYVWQHLANAGFVNGSYNGRRTTSIYQTTPGINVPPSKIGEASFMMRYFPTNTITTGYYGGKYGHVLFFGNPSGTADYSFTGSALTPEQAKSIDLKIDDGKPGLGNLRSLPPPTQSCADSASEGTAMYDGTVTTAACSLIFITGF